MMEYRKGGFWRRGVAYLFDKLVLYSIYLLLVLFEAQFLTLPYASRPDVPAGLWGEMDGPFLIGHFLIFIVLGMAYFTYFHASTGQTPGKALMNLRVIRDNGRNLTYGIAFLRWIGYQISRIPFYLGFIWIGIDGRKQGWHDKIAGTLVVIADDASLHIPPR